MPPEELLRPLAVDIFYFLLPILIGLVTFLIGRLFNRWSIAVRAGLVGLTVGAIFVVLALLFHAIPRPLELAVSYIGGVIVVLYWMILGVIGFSWASPKPSSDFFARFFFVLTPLVLIGIEAGGSLWFRFVDIETWGNCPSESKSGRMTQRTKMTCLPVAASMLAYQYKLVDCDKDDGKFSEGELAYLANTSFFGTDGHVMARVLTQKIGQRGVIAKMEQSTYDEMIGRAPFIAEVQTGKVGKHSVLVTSISKGVVNYCDPLEPIPAEVSPSTFDRMWTGGVIVIEGLSPELKAQ